MIVLVVMTLLVMLALPIGAVRLVGMIRLRAPLVAVVVCGVVVTGPAPRAARPPAVLAGTERPLSPRRGRPPARLIAAYGHQCALDQRDHVRRGRTLLSLTLVIHVCNYTFTCKPTCK